MKPLAAILLLGALFAVACGGDKKYSTYKTLASDANLRVLSEKQAKSAAGAVCDMSLDDDAFRALYFPGISNSDLGEEAAALDTAYC